MPYHDNYEGEGSFIPRGKETPDKIEGHELQDNEILTLNMANRVLTYTGHIWIVDFDMINGTYILMKTQGYVRLRGILCNGCGVIHPFFPIHN